MATRRFMRPSILWAAWQGSKHLLSGGPERWLQRGAALSNSRIALPRTLAFPTRWGIFSPQIATSSTPCRTFSAAAAPGKNDSQGEGEKSAVAKKRKRKKTFMEVAQFLPNWGLGGRFKKSHWSLGDFYKVTKVKVYKSGRHGAAWGVFHKDAVPKTGEVQKIGGVNKRCWRYLPDADPTAVAWKRSEAQSPLKLVPFSQAEAFLDKKTPTEAASI
ncbi:hypothetical protein KP509_13G042400 [Ceratopteris richardii]|nr:hypothetical protein KP509_13G042400 [Ceratopteris richardii]